ncbi:MULTISPECIES: hypothetical protein [Stenotrophomonas]|uniref:Phage tail protein n=2 Tax=Pseudomonadati TaxID=3379134 RepID=A0ABU5MP38_9GAMM|nr:hypothetical protein [Stenotrophomonas muris]MBN5070509.1 hypothetical protein [Stenotrophomonas maltophilia]MDZ7514337.1 hypothetical protein [Stenotrophomonas muris]
MALQPINIDTVQPNGKKGDPARIAFGKVNDNDAYLDGRISTVATAAATADTKATNAGSAAAAAVPKAGGEVGAMTGTLVMRGGGTAVRRANLFHNANSSNDFGAKWTLSYNASNSDLAGVFLVPTGANGFESQFQVWLKDGDFFNSAYVSMLVVTRQNVSFRGNNLWHAGNTTVDANNFIKRA